MRLRDAQGRDHFCVKGKNPCASTWSKASILKLLKSSSYFKKLISVSENHFHLHFTEILTSSLMEAKFTLSGVTLNSYFPLSDLWEWWIITVDWLSVKWKTNRSWKSLATWVVPPLLYLATLCAESEGESGVKITSTWSRGEPSRVYVHWRVMLSFSTGYNGLEGVEIKDGACSLQKRKNIVYEKVRLTKWSTSKVLEKEKGASLLQSLLIQHGRAKHADHFKMKMAAPAQKAVFFKYTYNFIVRTVMYILQV